MTIDNAVVWDWKQFFEPLSYQSNRDEIQANPKLMNIFVLTTRPNLLRDESLVFEIPSENDILNFLQYLLGNLIILKFKNILD